MKYMIDGQNFTEPTMTVSSETFGALFYAVSPLVLENGFNESSRSDSHLLYQTGRTILPLRGRNASQVPTDSGSTTSFSNRVRLLQSTFRPL
jgi:hypothetical protein